MDPVSQAVVGATAAQFALTDRLGKRAFACGAVGGLLPDLDVLIRSAADPLLAVEMHRHFTHALAMVPAGGAIAALPFLMTRDNRQRWRAIVAACTLGYASHAPLDVLTSYGTLWLGPMRSKRGSPGISRVSHGSRTASSPPIRPIRRCSPTCATLAMPAGSSRCGECASTPTAARFPWSGSSWRGDAGAASPNSGNSLPRGRPSSGPGYSEATTRDASATRIRRARGDRENSVAPP